MDKEQYVTYETAKLLKEKGFNWRVFNFYDEHGRFSEHIGSVYTLYNWNYPAEDGHFSQYCSAPTQQMACRWLREEKGLYVYANYGCYPILNEEYWIPEIGSIMDFDIPDDFYKEYNSPEDAIESALQYCLTNLI